MAVVQAIAQVYDAYFAQRFYAFSNKLLGDEREIFVFIFILTVSLLPYPASYDSFLSMWACKYSLNAKLSKSLEP